MKRAFFGVLGAVVVAAVATAAAQTPRPAAPPQQTFSGCLQKASTGAYVLVDAVDAKEGSGTMKKSYMLTGVVPGLRLADHMQKRIEVVGSVGDPTSADPSKPTLIMQAVKPVTGSCS